ncbi:MAG: hypothetical protein ACOH2F_10345 [Cellulomonas sp.]
MTTTWLAPAAVLARYASGWDGLWTLLYAAGQATANLAAVPGADDDLSLAYAALDISFALSELEQGLVSFADAGVAVDLGPVELADRAAAVGVVDDLLEAAQSLIWHLCHEPSVGGAEVLSATRVALTVGSARAKVTGGAW